jgi:hypothetical protein
MRRLTGIVLLAVVAASIAACGGGSRSASGAPGTPGNPLQARTPAGVTDEAPGSGAEPGYQKLVEDQSRRPVRRFSPCNLVTEPEARAIVGAPIEEPLEAPQGPTCIYRTRAGDGFITLAVQSQDIAQLKRSIRRLRRVDVSDRTAYCGIYGQPMLYLPLSRGRVLSVAARCQVARRFAVKAVPRLRA